MSQITFWMTRWVSVIVSSLLIIMFCLYELRYFFCSAGNWAQCPSLVVQWVLLQASEFLESWVTPWLTQVCPGKAHSGVLGSQAPWLGIQVFLQPWTGRPVQDLMT
jgi:hypothetical protein